MLKQRLIALLLAGSVALALGGTIAAAGEETPSPAGSQSADAASSAGQAEVQTQPDAAGTLSFANLEGRIRENELNIKMLDETIQALEVLDYDKMKDDLRDGLNQISNAQWKMINDTSALPELGSMLASSMQSSYDSLRETFDDLKEGKLQADNAARIRQLENSQDQVVIAGETLYAALLSMEATCGTLERKLAALDRQIQVAQLSYERGNLSALALEQAKAGRTSLVSSMETLRMNQTTYTMQLESLIGEELTGATRLQALPQITEQQLSAMDEAADLAAAKAASYELFAARRTLDEAEQSYHDAAKEYGTGSQNHNFLSAKHQWQAAQYTYAAAEQSFELKFKTLFLQVQDCAQIYEAAKAALAAEEAGYAAQELKYSQGSLSHNALLDAQDTLTEARESVASAALELFTSYNNYRWAVDNGILNG